MKTALFGVLDSRQKIFSTVNISAKNSFPIGNRLTGRVYYAFSAVAKAKMVMSSLNGVKVFTGLFPATPEDS